MIKRIIAVILLAATLAVFTSCGEKAPTAGSEQSTEAPAPTHVDFLKDGKTDFTIVYTHNFRKDVGQAISKVYAKLKKENVETEFELKMDNSDAAEKEIVIGKADREGQEEFYASIPANTFVIEVSEKCVRIGADTVELLIEAVEYFDANYLPKNSEGNIVFEIGRYVSEEKTASIVLNKTDKFVTKTEKVKDVKAIDGRRVMQGGCTDGKYLYMAMINAGHSVGQQEFAYIHKIDLETMETVMVSDAIPTDHSNDLTYVPATNEIYVNHCYEFPRINTVIDADTLKVKRQVEFPAGNNSISYSPKRDVFVYATRTMFRIVDRETMRVPLGYKYNYTPVDTPYTSQGSCVDDNYIYFVFYKENCIMVYDWNGEFVTKVEIDIKNEEPENLSIIGDTIYIGCNNSSWTGGTVYMGKIVKK